MLFSKSLFTPPIWWACVHILRPSVRCGGMPLRRVSPEGERRPQKRCIGSARGGRNPPIWNAGDNS